MKNKRLWVGESGMRDKMGKKKRLHLQIQPLQRIVPAYFMAVANTAVDAVATVGICLMLALASSLSIVSSGWFRA